MSRDTTVIRYHCQRISSAGDHRRSSERTCTRRRPPNAGSGADRRTDLFVAMWKDRQCLKQAVEERAIEANRALWQIWMAETKKDALAAFDAFVESWGVKYNKAVEC
jgi:hypothetical protein